MSLRIHYWRDYLGVTDLGGGLYHIDSFFDVFTELSVDSGPFEAQLNGSVRMELNPNSPEPATMMLLAAGLPMLIKRRRRS